jgi:hypothetical protein
MALRPVTAITIRLLVDDMDGCLKINEIGFAKLRNEIIPVAFELAMIYIVFLPDALLDVGARLTFFQLKQNFCSHWIGRIRIAGTRVENKSGFAGGYVFFQVHAYNLSWFDFKMGDVFNALEQLFGQNLR